MKSNVEHLRDEPMLNLVVLANDRTLAKLNRMIERTRMDEPTLRKILLGLLAEQGDAEYYAKAYGEPS